MCAAFRPLTCKCTTPHAPLEGNYKGIALTKYAESYNTKLCKTIVAGMKKSVSETAYTAKRTADEAADKDDDKDDDDDDDKPTVKRARRPANLKAVPAEVIEKLNMIP